MVRGPVLPVHSYVYVEPVWLNHRSGSPEPRDEQKGEVPVARQNVLRSSSFAELAVGGLPRVDKRRAPALPPEKTFAGSRRHYSYLLDQNRSSLEEDLVSEPALPQKYSTLWDKKNHSSRSRVGLPRSSGQRSLVNCGASQMRADGSDSDVSDKEKEDPSKGLMIRGNTRDNLHEGSSRRHASISSTLHGDSTQSLPPITSKSKRHSKKQVLAAVQNVDEWPELPPAFSQSLSRGTSPLPVQLSAGSAEPVHFDPLSPFPSGSSPRMVAGQWSPGSTGSSWRSGSLRARPHVDYNDALLRIYPLSEWEVRPRKPRRLREDPLNESYMSSSQSADDDLFDPSDLALFNFSVDGASPLNRVATAPAPRRRSSLACTEELKKATHPKLSMKDAARDLKVRRMSLFLREKKRRLRGSHPPKRGSSSDFWRVGTAPPGSSGSVGGIGGGGGLRWLHDDGEKPGSASDRRSLIGWHGATAEEMGQNGWSVSSLHPALDDAGSLFLLGGDADKVGSGSRMSRSSVSSLGLLHRRQQQHPQQKEKEQLGQQQDQDEQHEQSEQSEQKQHQQRPPHHAQHPQQQQQSRKPQHHQSPQLQKQHQQQQEAQQGGAEHLSTSASGSRRPTKQDKSSSLPSLHVGTHSVDGSVEGPEKSARGGTLRSAPLRSPRSAVEGFSPKGTPIITVNPASGPSADGHWPGGKISDADAMSPMPSGSDVGSRSGSRGAASGSSAAAKRRSAHLRDNASSELPSSRAPSRGTPGSKSSSVTHTPSGSPFHLDSNKSSRKPTRLGTNYLDDDGDGGGDTARSRSRSKKQGSKRSNTSQQHSDDTGDRPNTAASQDEDERLLTLLMARQQKREMQNKEAAAAVAAAAQAAAKKRSQKDEAGQEDKDGEEVFKPSRSMRSLTRPTSSHQLMPPLRMTMDDDGRSIAEATSFGDYTSISGSARTSALDDGKEGEASERSIASSAPVSSISTLDAPPLFKQVLPKTRETGEPDMLLPGYRRERGMASGAAHKTMRPPTADEKSSGSSTPTADLWDEAGHILYWDADDPNSLSRRFKDAIAEVWAEQPRPQTPDHIREAREWELILSMPAAEDNPTVNRWKKARARLPEISLQGLLRRSSSHLLDDQATANATSIHEVYSKMQVKNYVYRMEAKAKAKLNAVLRSQRGGFAGPWPGRLESCKRQLRGLDAFAKSYQAGPQPINA